MATIDIKLKSYDELIFEITKLNTDKYLLEQENKQLNSILTELEEWLETFDKKYLESVALCNISATIQQVQDKIQELKEKYK